MPPRKKAKASAASTPLGDGQPGTPQAPNTLSQDELLNDPWEDEQEIQLLKSMMKWKPTGLHKHFRMISIHNDMTSHGFASEKAPHTRIPGIWKKLDQLYDLETLDARENEFIFADSPDPNNRGEAGDFPDFELPEREFGEMIWQSRFHDSGSSVASSPPMVPIEDQKALYMPRLGLLKDVPDGVHSTKDESVAEATPPPKKSTRASRSTVKGGKGVKAGAAAKNTKAQSPSDSEEDEENEEEDDDDSSSESEEEEEEDSAPTTRRTNRTKAKPAPRRTRKR
ncbi:chromatin modification-related protein EAF7-domain-containing protein [Boeremia exigua]|uniref:chromatin modification-related protein EAF7-domain-containing protein n=1 Tax=Boeremia exigua TaxID=749465 RepID=UPI001E8D7B9B|nr:chromatin modification-related protein EAF7-domain-containing protein [Boeremia exigua]KAH6629527.1 chromatin modification-related protein EAF7-domain-containing protein [Boeremia exigua]